MTSKEDEVVIDRVALNKIKINLIDLFSFYSKLRDEHKEIEPYINVSLDILANVIATIENFLKK
jgi:hypothetical protein